MSLAPNLKLGCLFGHLMYRNWTVLQTLAESRLQSFPFGWRLACLSYATSGCIVQRSVGFTTPEVSMYYSLGQLCVARSFQPRKSIMAF